jgi:hypothetical protein
MPRLTESEELRILKAKTERKRNVKDSDFIQSLSKKLIGSVITNITTIDMHYPEIFLFIEVKKPNGTKDGFSIIGSRVTCEQESKLRDSVDFDISTYEETWALTEFPNIDSCSCSDDEN